MLEAYLLPGRPGYRPRTMPTVVEAIQSIHAAGGIAVWAHPFWDVQDTDEVGELLRRFRERGLDGVEAFYVTHSAAADAGGLRGGAGARAAEDGLV